MRSSPGTTRPSCAPRLCATSFVSSIWAAARRQAQPYADLRAAGNVVILSLDPENVTLEAEHFADVDRERFNERKPLLWFWQMFDRSPIGLNHWLGIRFRCMLGRHIFAHIGAGVKIYHGVDLTYGYNLSIGDGAVIRQRALLNDRGGISIGKGAVIGSLPAFTPTATARRVRRGCACATDIGAGARIASHAIVLAGHTSAKVKRWAAFLRPKKALSRFHF